MADLLNVATRALTANQAALQTAGHNISNVSTPGYSRQSVLLQTAGGQFTGGGFIGKGVDLLSIQRNHSEFLTQQAAASKSVAAADSTRLDQLNQLQNNFPTGTDGLGVALNNMLNALSDVASAPTDLTARTVVLTQVDETSARIRSTQAGLDTIVNNIKSALSDKVTTVNDLAKQIAQTNQQIAASAGAGQPPNDLLDRRDQLISDINQYVQTSQVAADDGSVTLFIQGSQPLVIGNTAGTLTITTDAFGDPSKSKLAFQRGVQTVALDESMLGGGEISGLLRFENVDMVEGTNLLGRLSLAMATQLNTQHQLGVDLNGVAGGPLFSLPVIPSGYAASSNTGTAVVDVGVANPNTMIASDYQIQFTGPAAGSVKRLSDGQVTTFATLPVQIDGLRIQLTSGAPAAGDAFLLKPFSQVSDGIAAAFSSPAALAVASPVEALVPLTNKGTLAVQSLQAVNASYTAPPVGGYALTFSGGPSYTYTISPAPAIPPAGVSPYSYLPGQPISIDGWNLTLKGVPQVGDTLTVTKATPTFQQTNAGNATALMALRDVATYDGAPLSDGYASLISQVGVRTQSAQSASQVSSTIANNLETERSSVAGVNLDEEAAKLLQFQQAYQASGKIIQIAQKIFDELIQGLT